MKLRFLGAAQTVTGSCFYIETETNKFLVDCGMYQGVGIEAKNREPFDFDPSELDFVLLTHAHIDHSGLIPKLFKYGFRGVVYLTPQTAALTRILLLDSAKIQEKDSQEEIKENKGEIIYSTEDAMAAIDSFTSVNFFEKTTILGNDFFQFIPAGHILGAASVYFEVEGKGFIFSGDLGRINQSIVKNFFDYDIPDLKPDYIIGESLYGNSLHPNREEAVGELMAIINETLQRNGNVIIPSFALHRTQEIIEILKLTTLIKEIKPNVQMFLDSPMAIAIGEVYATNFSLFNSAFYYKDLAVSFDGAKLQDKRKYVFNLSNSNRLQFDDLRYIRKAKKSLKLLNKSNALIIAGSGMADGGRIVHHLYNGLEHGKNSVIFVGFQAEGTLGRQLVDGAAQVQINDRMIDVKAKIHYLRGFSAHADQNDLKLWLKKYTSSNLKKVFLIHAEEEVQQDYSKQLASEGYNVEIPKLKGEYIL